MCVDWNGIRGYVLIAVVLKLLQPHLHAVVMCMMGSIVVTSYHIIVVSLYCRYINGFHGYTMKQ